MHPPRFYSLFLFSFLWHTVMWNWISCRVQLIWSVRLVLRAISYSRHVLMPVSSMNFGHEWFCAFAWSCTVSKGCQWPGQAVLGGCLYIICQDDMLLKTLRLLIKRNCHPSFFFFLYPDFPFGGESKLRRSVDAVFYLFFFFLPLSCYKSFGADREAELGWNIQHHTLSHSLTHTHTLSLSLSLSLTHVQYLEDDSY